MKQGNQFYLNVRITDKDKSELDIEKVNKAQFNIDTLTKTYDGINDEVTYDEESKSFLIWLKEEETFVFPAKVKIDARVLFKDKTIIGSFIKTISFQSSLKEVLLDDERQNN